MKRYFTQEHIAQMREKLQTIAPKTDRLLLKYVAHNFADLKETLANDKKGKPPGKYAVLADAQQWATNVGFPGYANAAIDEIYSTWVLNTMFAQAATGAMSPEDAVKEADAKARKIWQKWKERKLL